MENLFTLEIEERKQEFFFELLENLDFVQLQDNNIWKEIFENQKKTMEKEENKKPKRFTDFSLQAVKEIFELEEKERETLFPNIQEIEKSDWLKETLAVTEYKSLNTEKERSEALVYPVLLEIEKRNNFSFKVFSGENVVFDAERGLKGELDFAFSQRKTSYLEAPIFNLVEAKQGDITKHWGQLIAQMVGARIENNKENNALKTIFGCITTGEYWHFSKLEGNFIYIDTRSFSIYVELEKILGIFQYVVDFFESADSK